MTTYLVQGSTSMSWYLTASISTLVRYINATYMYYDRVAVGREDSPSESVNPWCHDLRVFRVIFLKGNTSCLLVEVSQVQEDQEDNTPVQCSPDDIQLGSSRHT